MSPQITLLNRKCRLEAFQSLIRYCQVRHSKSYLFFQCVVLGWRSKQLKLSLIRLPIPDNLFVITKSCQKTRKKLLQRSNLACKITLQNRRFFNSLKHLVGPALLLSYVLTIIYRQRRFDLIPGHEKRNKKWGRISTWLREDWTQRPKPLPALEHDIVIRMKVSDVGDHDNRCRPIRQMTRIGWTV